uniref:Fatty acid hydroxylase domain-containing protein n=1 Tax=Ditylenchus dipsaci TaxID=166011 RepID=A0A915D6M9_9BILA
MSTLRSTCLLADTSVLCRIRRCIFCFPCGFSQSEVFIPLVSFCTSYVQLSICCSGSTSPPFELFFVGTFITVFPWAFKTHCLTYWLWFVVAQSVSYEVHIGYDFPFMLHRFIPIYSGAPAHDMHHMRPLSCFQPWLNYLDRIFGYHLSYDQLKRMNKERSERFAKYQDGEENGLKKIN